MSGGSDFEDSCLGERCAPHSRKNSRVQVSGAPFTINNPAPLLVAFFSLTTIESRRRSKSELHHTSNKHLHPAVRFSELRVRAGCDAGLEIAVDVGQSRERSDPQRVHADPSVMSPVVRVPVLSLQNTSMVPKFSMAARCLTMTGSAPYGWRRWPRVTEWYMGRNSGVKPTASATANTKDSNASLCMAMRTTRMNSTRKKTVRVISKPNRRKPRWNSVPPAGRPAALR